MNKGTLSFALDGEYWGEAFKSPALTKGPIYPAISLLHHAGCKINVGKSVPIYFK
jgi:E3 ubiquitin-protein ligase NRDP1